jgi:FtsH-binding integral membrane protein
LNGITLTALLLAYTTTSIAGVFVCTAAIFGVMAAIGYTTKKDLTSLGMLSFIALIGIIIASLINFFLKSNTLSYILSYVIILVFLGLTAYDTQKLKKLSASGVAGNLGVLGALTLYLDFINIFINLLRIFGKRN